MRKYYTLEDKTVDWNGTLMLARDIPHVLPTSLNSTGIYTTSRRMNWMRHVTQSMFRMINTPHPLHPSVLNGSLNIPLPRRVTWTQDGKLSENPFLSWRNYCKVSRKRSTRWSAYCQYKKFLLLSVGSIEEDEQKFVRLQIYVKIPKIYTTNPTCCGIHEPYIWIHRNKTYHFNCRHWY